jgi:two-component system, OmpR family, phosphate regulon response regulator PhoB
MSEALARDLDNVFGLTPTESRLLSVLRGEPGRVFSRKELVRLVMPQTIVLERTIDVHIRGLRKKLGALASCIRTVRRGGYSYLAEPSIRGDQP